MAFDKRYQFWQNSFYRRDGEYRSGREDYLGLTKFIGEQEGAIRNRFGSALASFVRPHIGDSDVLIIKVRAIDYSSLNILLEVISTTADRLGIKSDDVIDLLERYTPPALSDTTELRENEITVHANGIITDDDKSVTPQIVRPATTGNDKPNNHFRAWLISNFSLVLPSIILLVAAYLISASTQEERNKLTDALIKERAELSAQRDKLLDRYENSLKLLQQRQASQEKYFNELRSIDAKSAEEKNKSAKDKNAEVSKP